MIKQIRTDIDDVCIVEPKSYADQRGEFFSSYSREDLLQIGIDMAVENVSLQATSQYQLFGLHYQQEPLQACLMGAIQGDIYAVGVDMRPASPSYQKHVAAVLSQNNQRYLYLPEGFARGFVTLSERALVLKHTSSTSRGATLTSIRWNDATLAINWPISRPLIQHKDAQAPFINELTPIG